MLYPLSYEGGMPCFVLPGKILREISCSNELLGTRSKFGTAHTAGRFSVTLAVQRTKTLGTKNAARVSDG